jgi:hypothetical protein
VIVFAHTGHVLIDLGIFLGPVAGIAGWVYLADWREKRRKQGEGRERPPRS